MEYQGIQFDPIQAGDLVDAMQILPIDLAIVGLLSSRPGRAFRAGVEVAHIGIRAEFA